MNFQSHKLDNGLTIIAECLPEAYTAAVGYFVMTGARDETPELMGVSHFLEHMMFKGTDRRTADDVNREFDEIGADYNAFTSHEQTVFFAHVLPEQLPRAVDLLGDILRPSLRGDDFAMEKNVILEEIGMYDDRPTWRLQDTILERYFPNHPLGFRVLGTKDTIGRLTAEQMRGYFGQRYSPDNTVVAAAGRIDFDALVRDVERMSGSWPATGARRSFDAPATEPSELTIEDARVNRHYVAVMWPGPAYQDADRYAAKVLADVVGDSDGSRLYWALVDPGLAEEADASVIPQDRVGYHFAFASCDPDRADGVERILLETLASPADGVEDEELERAKNKIATGATVQGERPPGRMMRLGGDWMYLHEHRPLDEEIERVMAVSLSDVHRVAEAYPPRPRTIVRLTPKRS